MKSKSLVKPDKFIVEAVLTVGKQGIIKKYIKVWMAETLLAQARREGWAHLLKVRVRSVDRN